MAKQVYEVNGRRVTKEQHDKAAKEMDKPKSQAEKDMMDFANAARNRSKLTPINKAKGGWIKDAIKKPGSLRKSLGVKKGEKIPAGKLAAAAKKPGKMGQRARLAQTLKGLKK